MITRIKTGFIFALFLFAFGAKSCDKPHNKVSLALSDHPIKGISGGNSSKSPLSPRDALKKSLGLQHFFLPSKYSTKEKKEDKFFDEITEGHNKKKKKSQEEIIVDFLKKTQKMALQSPKKKFISTEPPLKSSKDLKRMNQRKHQQPATANNPSFDLLSGADDLSMWEYLTFES